MKSAGKWIARDRGALEPDEQPVALPEVPREFPMAERLSDESLVLLFSFRSQLRTIDIPHSQPVV